MQALAPTPTVLATPGATPSTLALLSATACPLGTNPTNDGVHVASLRLGSGKVVVASHNGLAAADVAFTSRVVGWVSPVAAPRIVVLGYAQVANQLAQAGLTNTAVDTLPALSAYDVLVMHGSSRLSDDDVTALRAFVESGKGLFVAGQSWSFNDSEGDAVANYGPNRLLRSAGIVILPTYSDGPTSIRAGLSDLYRAGDALDALTNHITGTPMLSPVDLALASRTARQAISALSPGNYQALFWRATAFASKVAQPPPTQARPLNVATNPLGSLAIAVECRLALASPADETRPHPAAADFPGLVTPGTPTVRTTLTLSGTYAGRDRNFGPSSPGAPRWYPTGLYAAPGAPIRVRIPPTHTSGRISVQIGAHTDRLWNLSSWQRMPELVRTESLRTTDTVIASGFGGPVYLTVDPGSTLGPFTAEVEGGVEMAIFAPGTGATWAQRMSGSGAPWIELATASLIITVPRSEASRIANPESLMQLWDSVLDAQADLAAIPRTRPRPERFALDRQISAGYMHSGYPMMGGLDVDALNAILSEAHIRSGRAWGPFHEIGHNHQWSPFVFPNTVESSVNLFSVISLQRIGLTGPMGHTMVTSARRQQTRTDYRAGTLTPATWGPWDGLEMYLLLQERFGWDFFTTLWRDRYYSRTAPIPEAEKADVFMRLACETAQRDLTAYFDAWRMTMTAPTRAACVQLGNPWVDHPMQ
ncbi:MAG: M60 family metallopeptidase [Myxococcales bacterium]|nr:M60 family metallopeptidase [Myxococcales bacterium]